VDKSPTEVHGRYRLEYVMFITLKNAYAMSKQSQRGKEPPIQTHSSPY